jgi:hypothetical protein
MGKVDRERSKRSADRTSRRSAFLRLLSGLVCLGMPLLVLARPSLPPPPPPPPPPAGAQDGRPEGALGNPRNLSPEQRDAIRRLSQEEREAMANRQAQRQQGRPGANGPRLSPEERRHLRQQIREEHERRGGRFGSGKRP